MFNAESDYAFWCRPLPPLPNLEISEKTSGKVADELQVWVNFALSIAHDIAIGRNLKLLLKVRFCLSFCTFYVGLILNFNVFALKKLLTCLVLRLLCACG